MGVAYASLDSSGNFKFIALVLVFDRDAVSEYEPHVAGLKKLRERAISSVADGFRRGKMYGVCLRTRRLANLKPSGRVPKSVARRRALAEELNRMKQHLLSVGLSLEDVPLFADREFERDADVIASVFGTDRVYVAKSKEVLPADVLAYLNLKRRSLVRSLRNVKEL